MTEPTGPVLVATSLDASSDHALQQGVELAGDLAAPLIVCHVLPEILRPRPVFPHLHEVDRARAAAWRETALRGYDEQRKRAGVPDSVGPLRLESGTPHAGILSAAEETGAAWIVVGPDAAGERGVGNVAERVIRHAAVPVLVARTRRPGPVLAATDFSDPSLPAIEAARREADRRKRPFAIVHVMDLFPPLPVSPETAGAVVSSEVFDVFRQDAERRLASVAESKGPAAGAYLRIGLAADQILALEEELEADLVVMGTHGRSGVSHFALGSIAEAVVRRAAGSVMVVRLG